VTGFRLNVGWLIGNIVIFVITMAGHFSLAPPFYVYFCSI